MNAHILLIKLGAALLIALQIVGTFVGNESILPLGHSELAQTGIVLGGCFVYAEIVEIVKKWIDREK